MSLRAVCLIAVICWLSAGAPVHSQTDKPIADADRELTVGVKEAPPFAMKAANGEWSGLSIDLWRQVAGERASNINWSKPRRCRT